MKKNQSKDSLNSVAQKDIDSCVTELGRMTDTVGRGAKPFSSQERKRLPKPRRDGHVIARELAQLAVKYGIAAAVNVDAMLNAVAEVEGLKPLDASAANFSHLVRDRVLEADAVAWKIATTIYTFLQRLSRDDAALARDLERVAASFASHASNTGNATGKTAKPTAIVTAQPAPVTKPTTSG
jgi:hypothetical protein